MTEESRPWAAPTPDDRELEQYLKGDSALSRRYREASRESAPPELDEAVLARAHSELRRRPSGINRWLTPVALAASVLLGVNLGWNVHKAEPQPREADLAERRKAQAAESERKVYREQAFKQEQESAAVEERALLQRQAEPLRREALAAASADRAAAAPATALSESAKIDRLINHIGKLHGATFIRSGKEYGATEAARHLQSQREKAGDRVRTADDFIRLCASHSYLPGEAYLIRFADGRTRTAEDVLREELARLEGRKERPD